MKACTGVIAFALSTFAAAQSPSVAVPSQFASARTLFLGSGGAAILDNQDKEGTAMLYPSAYNALSSAGRYRLTSTPAEAEIYAVISIEGGQSSVSHGTSSQQRIFIRLAVFDTKTHALLWNIDEPLSGAIRKATFQKNIDESVAQIVIDLNSLAAGKLP